MTSRGPIGRRPWPTTQVRRTLPHYYIIETRWLDAILIVHANVFLKSLLRTCHLRDSLSYPSLLISRQYLSGSGHAYYMCIPLLLLQYIYVTHTHTIHHQLCPPCPPSPADRHATATVEEREKEEVIFKEVSEAYQVLSDPRKKSRYDSGQDPEEHVSIT